MKGFKSMVPSWAGYSAKSSGPTELCQECKTRPKFVESGGFRHPYCGRKCAASASAARPTSLLVSPAVYAYNKPQAGASTLPLTKPQTETWVQIPPKCGLHSCLNASRPQFSGYCTDGHAKHAVRKGYSKACTQCRTMPQFVGPLCVSCQRAGVQVTTLKEVHRNDPNFGNIASVVESSWRPTDGSTAPKVHKILKVCLPQRSLAKFENYRAALEKDGPVTETTTFHSSQCICDLGTKSQHSPCDIQSCGICSIVKSNFNRLAFGESLNKGRLGAGIYSYTNSARADVHATSCTTSPYRIMLLCSALVGRKKNGAAQPSTYAKSVIDGDTVLVADPDAITPDYIICYIP